MEIVVIDSGYDSYKYEERLFEENGFEFKVFDGGHHDREGKIVFASKAVGILVWWTQVDEAFLRQMPELKAIVRYGVGYEKVDLEATKLHGVRVANVQSYANHAVSDHALALLLSCSRRLSFRQQTLLKDSFGKPPATDVIELSNKTVGIVGLGRIGGTFCRKAQSLFEQVLAVDPYIPAERFTSLGAEQCDFQTLLHESDAVSDRMCILKNLLVTLWSRCFPIHVSLQPGRYAWYSIKSSEELQKRAVNNLLALLRGDEVEDELPEKKRY